MLAITSAVLALFGYDVDCACYSAYLIDRDKYAFRSLFESFGVQGHIQYGTFNGLCEDLLNRRGQLREVLAARINGEIASTIEDKAMSPGKRMK